ncbi:MAG TPA: manganese efflux pump [Gaiellaceae bacterium]|jgi:putative Mn2+ efflux pump MntP|nr:manganese efflux pump [Gaiellaceae bacterium]
MVSNLLILGLTLSLDNFRTAIALGALRLKARQVRQVALAFGLWDAVAPLLGILVGRYLGERIGSTAEYVGAIALGAYGLYLLVRAWHTRPPNEFDQLWALFGLPLPLSLDNILAGTSLGLLGFSPWLAPAIFGVMTTVMSFVGLQLGRTAAQFIRVRSDVLSGIALVAMSSVLGLRLMT